MSKLYIKDLERIKNGKLVRFNETTKERYSSLVSLSRIQNEINEFRNIRFDLLKKFQKDIDNELDFKKGSKIDYNRVSFSPTSLFIEDYLALYIANALGDSLCLFNKNGMVSTSGFGYELEEKSEIILPFIKKLFNVKENSNVLDNSFYDTYPIYDDNTKVLNINGDGITLPFYEYSDFENEEVQELLGYYYSNYKDIIKNILIPNTEKLNNYKTNDNKEKVLKLYKGVK